MKRGRHISNRNQSEKTQETNVRTLQKQRRRNKMREQSREAWIATGSELPSQELKNVDINRILGEDDSEEYYMLLF